MSTEKCNPVSSARNAGESAICGLRAQPSAQSSPGVGRELATWQCNFCAWSSWGVGLGELVSGQWLRNKSGAWICSIFTRSNLCQRHSARCSCSDRNYKLQFVPAWQTDISSGSSRKMERKATPSCTCWPIRMGKLLTESFVNCKFKLPLSDESCGRNFPGVPCAARSCSSGVCPMQPKGVLRSAAPEVELGQSRN